MRTVTDLSAPLGVGGSESKQSYRQMRHIFFVSPANIYQMKGQV